MIYLNANSIYFLATFVSLAPILVCEMVGVEKLPLGYGLIMLERGLAIVTGPPLGGKF